MGDRRMGDRREKEKGVIKLKLHEAIIYIVVAAALIASVTFNIILYRANKLYREYINEMDSSYMQDYYDSYDEE